MLDPRPAADALARPSLPAVTADSPTVPARPDTAKALFAAARHLLPVLEAVAALEPSHTKRSEEQVRLQQFSTPLALANAVLQAAAIRPGDVVLEPSAGTGMLAVMAASALGERVKDALHLNEIAPGRAGLLAELFPGAAITRHNAEAIADRLPDCRPTVVLMNPPFSATPGVGRIRHDADLRHLRAAFAMLPPGGRLAAVTSAQCLPGDAAWTAAFAQSDPPAHCVFTLAIDGRAYARRGSGADIDNGIDRKARAANAAELLDAVIARVPPRLPVEPVPITVGTDAGPDADLFSRTRDAKPPTPRPKTIRKRGSRPTAASTPTHDWGPISELASRPARLKPLPIPPASAPAPTRRGGQRRCAFRARAHIRRPWCSPPPWPRCRIQRRPTVRCCPSAS